MKWKNVYCVSPVKYDFFENDWMKFYGSFTQLVYSISLYMLTCWLALHTVTVFFHENFMFTLCNFFHFPYVFLFMCRFKNVLQNLISSKSVFAEICERILIWNVRFLFIKTVRKQTFDLKWQKIMSSSWFRINNY